MTDLRTLEEIQQRVLWLATRIIDHANRERPADEIKVGGHQASSASMVGIMTALWFGHLNGDDKVAVKPHASPVYHAIKYLTGELDASYLTELRSFGGLQAYPSRTKDPDVDDFSTGSVGLGVVAPLFAAATRRYIDNRFGPVTERPARFIALAGDAELDEGNVWEAINEPALAGLGNVTLIVDANRQSLDRVIPGQKIKRLMEFFDGAGWHVVEAKYGRLLTEAFERPGGDALRDQIDSMSNERYQSLFALRGSALREKFCEHGSDELRAFIADVPDGELAPLIQNLGGHDLRVLIESFRRCDDVADRPSVVFAYTVKGWGLPIAGDPLNHSMQLTGEQIDEFRASVGLDVESEWDRFDPESDAGRACRALGQDINNPPRTQPKPVDVPRSVGGRRSDRPVSSQDSFGRLLTRLADDPEVRERLVTTSPDVSVSTNLGGWINKMGVFVPTEQEDHLGPDRILKWHQTPSGHHIELGISEMNLFLMLHALGLGHDLHGEHLLPVGTVYDPFVCRGLDALIYALYNGARFIVVGTPAGVTLAPEGGAHQSSITPSIGTELPHLDAIEPAFAGALDWLLCDSLARLARADGASSYFRLSTRPIDQGPFNRAADRLGEDELRQAVLAGGYRLREPDPGPADVVLASSGPPIAEVLAAADALADEGVDALVLDITSSDRLYRGWQETTALAARTASVPAPDHQLARLLGPAERAAPIVTVHDAASHHLAWLGSVFGTRVVAVGVDGFGQSGTIRDLYGHFGMLPDQIVNAALVALS